MPNIQSLEQLESAGIKPGQLIYLRTHGSGDAGDLVEFVKGTADGIMIAICVKLAREFLKWNQIAELHIKRSVV